MDQQSEQHPSRRGVVVALPTEWAFDPQPALTRFWDRAAAAAPNLLGANR